MPARIRYFVALRINGMAYFAGQVIAAASAERPQVRKVRAS